MNTDHRHIVGFDIQHNKLVVHRLSPEGDTVLYTEVPISDRAKLGDMLSFRALCERLGEIILLDSPTGRGLSDGASHSAKKTMKIDKIDEPIAQRTLTAGDDAIVVTIGKPAPLDNDADYCCPYSIEYREKRKLSYAVGADAVQALQLVMKKIGADLAHIGENAKTQVSWFPDTPGETGFPS